MPVGNEQLPHWPVNPRTVKARGRESSQQGSHRSGEKAPGRALIAAPLGKGVGAVLFHTRGGQTQK